MIITANFGRNNFTNTVLVSCEHVLIDNFNESISFHVLLSSFSKTLVLIFLQFIKLTISVF
jgi:hypothetical protein